ncbi:MAG TPA: CBS domain-containing protein, partial [Thermoanaerobaculia bacterium]|nr:CBS domain-containing protein [Thermoanaerobaculia bacterium]
MRVRDVMTKNPFCAGPTTTVAALARLMADSNCGEIPICKDGRLVGIVTDRDITCRTVARQL